MNDSETYNAIHSLCPNCGSSEIESTTMGMDLSNIETAIDKNKALCLHSGCGWNGTVDELRPSRTKLLMVVTY